MNTTCRITSAVAHPESVETWRLQCLASDANLARRYDDEDYLRAVVSDRERRREADRHRARTAEGERLRAAGYWTMGY